MYEEVYGKIAYEAYCKQTGGKSFAAGDPLPAWDGLRIDIREAWVAAADAVRDTQARAVLG